MQQRPEPPALSVVIVSINSLRLLERCLAAVVAEPAHDVEILVVRDPSRVDDAAERAAIAARYPAVTWVAVPPGDRVPLMRKAGVSRSSGSVVALIEDDCVVVPGWSASVIEAHDDVHVAVGGAVEPDKYQRALDWAAFFSDYASFLLPFTTNDTSILPGNNVSYPRRVVADLLRTAGEHGIEEAFVHKAWHEAGRPMSANPRMVVTNVHRWAPADLTSVPFHHARAFAGRRAASMSAIGRLLFASGAVALPAVLTARTVGRVIRCGRHRGDLARAAGWLVIFALSWSAGEFCGYLAGPGRAAGYWR